MLDASMRWCGVSRSRSPSMRQIYSSRRSGFLDSFFLLYLEYRRRYVRSFAWSKAVVLGEVQLMTTTLPVINMDIVE